MLQFLIAKANSPLDDAERREWVQNMAASLAMEFMRKVNAGRLEHGCDMGMIPAQKLLDELQAELIDANAYLLELRRRFSESVDFILIERSLLVELLRIAEQNEDMMPGDCKVIHDTKLKINYDNKQN